MSRLFITKTLVKLIKDNRSLADLKATLLQIPLEDRPFVQECCFGVARWFYKLRFIVDQLLQKPLKTKDMDIYLLMILGVYQLLYTHVPSHAVINETVEVARLLKKEWATKLVNGVLRQFIRSQSALLETVQTQQAYYSHPQWLIDKIKVWNNYQTILEANNQHPPMCLRVNPLKISLQDYLELLTKNNQEAKVIPYTEQGLLLTQPTRVSELPCFDEGFVSVQDGGAQLAAQLLDPKPNEHILDACAAPGGKTCHILEKEPNIASLVALDDDQKRLSKVQENLDRMGLSAKLICHDVQDLGWWDGQLFDRILLDVPCSSVGVIRRHPDIKIIRKDTDLQFLTQIQYNALKTLWVALKQGGSLLYVSCSILPEENEAITSRFLAANLDCCVVPLEAPFGVSLPIGTQILPGMYPGMDGFYFAKFKKM